MLGIRARALLGLAVLALASLPATTGTARADDGPLDLPNLSPLAPTNVAVALDDTRRKAAVRFSVTTDNIGRHHLDLLGTTPEGSNSTTAEQCVRWRYRVCEERVPVGAFALHAAHGHWHLDDFALYELRKIADDGQPDMSADGLVRSGGKVSFCLLDYGRGRGARADDDFYPFTTTGFYVACTGVHQGISAGWSDTYEAGLPGQQIVIDGVAPGTYAVVVTVNPDGRLLETTTADNSAHTIVQIDARHVGVG